MAGAGRWGFIFPARPPVRSAYRWTLPVGAGAGRRLRGAGCRPWGRRVGAHGVWWAGVRGLWPTGVRGFRPAGTDGLRPRVSAGSGGLVSVGSGGLVPAGSGR